MNTPKIIMSMAVLMLSATLSWAEFPMRAAPSFTRPASILQHPEQLQGINEVEGKVQAIDLYSRVITLRDPLGHAWKIRVGPDTPITDINRGSLKLADLTEDETVHIYFDTRDMTARQIDRITRGFLGDIFSAS